MGQINVVFTTNVVKYLDELVHVLYKEEYFGFIDSAEQYVVKIYDYVTDNIHQRSHYFSPLSLKYLGSNYIFYNSNKRTTWYIFFEKNDNDYLITGVVNNHCEEAKVLRN